MFSLVLTSKSSILGPKEPLVEIKVTEKIKAHTIAPGISKLIDSKQPGISKHFMFPKISFSA